MKYRLYFYILSVLIVMMCSNCSTRIDDKAVSIAFTGDIIMHIPVKTCARVNDRFDRHNSSLNNRGYDYLFEGVRKTLRKSDSVMGNMEFPVSNPYKSKPYIFNCYPEVIPAMKKAGFTLVTIANNHILDQGTKGLIETVGQLGRHGLRSIGAGADEPETRSGYIFKKNGIRVGFLAYTRVINTTFPDMESGVYINNFNKTERVYQDIRAIRDRCDFLVMTVHTGSEYSRVPDRKDVLQFRRCLEAGVDLIIGHHPHILQRIERHTTGDGRNCYIFYSLGNFISNQSSTFKVRGFSTPLSVRDSVIVNCRLVRSEKGISQAYTIIPIRTVNLAKKSWRHYRDIRPVPIAIEYKELKKILRARDIENRKSLLQKKEYLENKFKLIKSVLTGNEVYENITIPPFN